MDGLDPGGQIRSEIDLSSEILDMGIQSSSQAFRIITKGFFSQFAACDDKARVPHQDSHEFKFRRCKVDKLVFQVEFPFSQVKIQIPHFEYHRGFAFMLEEAAPCKKTTD